MKLLSAGLGSVVGVCVSVLVLAAFSPQPGHNHRSPFSQQLLHKDCNGCAAELANFWHSLNRPSSVQEGKADTAPVGTKG